MREPQFRGISSDMLHMRIAAELKRSRPDQDRIASMQSIIDQRLETIKNRRERRAAKEQELQEAAVRRMAQLPSTWRRDVDAVCRERGLQRHHVLSRSRSTRLARARFEIWSRIRSRGRSKNEIGMRFGYDHTSVLHGLRQVEAEAAGA